MQPVPWPRLWLACAAALLGACTSLNPDGGFAAVQRTAQQHLGPGVQLQWARSEAELQALDGRVAELLQQPLSADAAVQLALLNNRGLQAEFQALGISDAERVQASRLPNPGFSIGRLRRGDEVETERGLHLNLAQLIARPWVTALEDRRVEQTQAQAAAAVLGLAADTRRAWLQAVAAGETLRYARQVLQAAEAGAELARRMEQAGNFSALQRAREQAFQADAQLALTRAGLAQLAARERLARLLGLAGGPPGDPAGTPAAYTLPERLPDLPDQLPAQPDIERQALAQRLDVQAARARVAQTAQQLGLTRRTRFINVLELGAVRNGSNQAPVQRGWEVSLELPLFDWGDARVARAEGLYMQALHQAADVAQQAQSDVRQAYAASRASHAIARQHADVVVPLRKRIADENLLRYNGMLIGVFELLADARAQIAGVNAAIEAKRDFWLAQADLAQALAGPVRLAALAMPALPTDAAAPAH